MINLLPPDLKTQIRFAKRNRAMVGYLKLSVGIIVVLAAIFAGTIFFVNKEAEQVAKSIKLREEQLAQSLVFQKEAREASERLLAIKSLEASQTKFSVLLDDLSKVLPQGVSLEGITLTGDDKKPLSIAVIGNSYDSILAFRNAVLLSPRILGADLVTITNTANGFQGNVVIAFKAGQAK